MNNKYSVLWGIPCALYDPSHLTYTTSASIYNTVT